MRRQTPSLHISSGDTSAGVLALIEPATLIPLMSPVAVRGSEWDFGGDTPSPFVQSHPPFFVLWTLLPPGVLLERSSRTSPLPRVVCDRTPLCANLLFSAVLCVVLLSSPLPSVGVCSVHVAKRVMTI